MQSMPDNQQDNRIVRRSVFTSHTELDLCQLTGYESEEEIIAFLREWVDASMKDVTIEQCHVLSSRVSARLPNILASSANNQQPCHLNAVLEFCRRALNHLLSLGFETRIHLLGKHLEVYVEAQKTVLDVDLTRYFTLAFLRNAVYLVPSYEGPIRDFPIIHHDLVHVFEVLDAVPDQVQPLRLDAGLLSIPRSKGAFTGHVSPETQSLAVTLPKTTRSRTDSGSLRCIFLELPLEIRYLIYDCLLDHATVMIDRRGFVGAPSPSRVQVWADAAVGHFNIRLVNRQIKNEFFDHLRLLRFRPLVIFPEKKDAKIQKLTRASSAIFVFIFDPDGTPGDTTDDMFSSIKRYMDAFLPLNPSVRASKVVLVITCPAMTRHIKSKPSAADWALHIRPNDHKLDLDIVLDSVVQGPMRFPHLTSRTAYRRLRSWPFEQDKDIIVHQDDPLSLLRLFDSSLNKAYHDRTRAVMKSALLDIRQKDSVPYYSLNELQILKQIIPYRQATRYQLNFSGDKLRKLRELKRLREDRKRVFL